MCSEAESTEYIKRSTFCEATRHVPHHSGGAAFDIEWHDVDAVCTLLTPVSHRWAVREWERQAPHAIDTVHHNRSDIVTHKAAACVVRTRDRGPELLVFRHPLAGVQIPKGTIESAETAADAGGSRTRRRIRHRCGSSASDRSDGISPTLVRTRQTLDRVSAKYGTPFLMAADAEQRESWSQHASGSEIEASLVFECFWLPLAEARIVVAPRYVASVDFVATAIAADPDGERRH